MAIMSTSQSFKDWINGPKPSMDAQLNYLNFLHAKMEKKKSEFKDIA